MVLNDWQRGKLPFYVPPPGFEEPLTKTTDQIPIENNNSEKEDVDMDKTEDTSNKDLPNFSYL